MKSKNKTRWGNMQTVRVERDMFFTSPLEGEDVRRTDEGEVLKSLLTPPHPAFGHPLPQGARRSMFGFTLIEVLVVVLIIGVLAAIALPQYQKAVLKSRFSALMPLTKTLADANETYYLEHGNYADNPQELTVQGQENYPDGTSVLMYSDEADLSFVRTANASIPNARYVVYQKHSTNFPDTTWCEASDEQAEAMCVALGGVLPEGLEGNSGADENWKAYLLGGQARPGDTFANGDDNGGDEPGAGDEPGTNTEPQTPTKPTCGGVEQPDDIAPTESKPATGTATCVNGQWKYTWMYATDYTSLTTVCKGNSAYACAGSEFKGKWNRCDATQENGCAGSTFSGEGSYCSGKAANGCAGSTFSGETSQCFGPVANGCAGSTFSGEKSTCYGNAANGCAGSTFSGERSQCYGHVANGCAGTNIQAGAICIAVKSGACDGAKYGADPTGQRTGIGGCNDAWGYCPTGVPVTNTDSDWNSTNGSYDYTWKGGYCDPNAMVSGNCPAGSPKQGGGCWDGNGNQTSC